MGLEAIVEEIKAKGKKEAERINTEADKEVSKLIAEAQVSAARIKSAREEALRKEIDRMRQQELSSANLEVKKAILNARKEILDEVIEAARNSIARIPAEKNQKILKSIIQKNYEGNSRIFGRENDTPLLKTLTKLEYAGNIDCLGGVIIENADGTQVLDFRYDIILKNVTDQSLKQISDILFG